MNKHRLLTANITTAILVAMYYLSSLIIGGVIIFFPSADAGLISSFIIYLLGFLPVIIFYGIFQKKVRRQTIVRTFRMHTLSPLTILSLVLLGLSIQPIASLIATLSNMVFRNVVSETLLSDNQSLWLMLLTTAVFPAVFEELFCRGVLLDGYEEAPFWYQLLIPAAFFGMLHGNFQQIAYALPLGIFLGYVVLRTGSIWSSILVHFIFNGSQVTLSYLDAHTDLFKNSVYFTGGQTPAETLLAVAVVAVPALAVTALLLAWLHHLTKDSPKPQPLTAPSAMPYQQQPFTAPSTMPYQQPFTSPITDPYVLAAMRKENSKYRWHRGGWIMYVILGFLFLSAVAFEFLLPLVTG